MRAINSFEALLRAATLSDDGKSMKPYPWQCRVADEGLPEVIGAPTGSGKTTVVLAWLWRRRFHPDVGVRKSTPRRLLFALPMRVLVEQTYNNAVDWIRRLGLLDADDGVGVHRLIGGTRHGQRDWFGRPEGDAIVVGTMDMLLSRALNRGYAEGRYIWPISFGLANNDTHWVFDEIQLMGAGLPTSRQLQSFRDRLGTAAATASTWMSATLSPELLATVDNPEIGTSISTGPEDEESLGARLNAPKRVQQLSVESKKYEKVLTEQVLAAHQPATRTLVVLNTVARAQDVAGNLRKLHPEAGVVLLHSRFRLGDRAGLIEEATAHVPGDGPGVIVVATQVIEAGVDMSAATLITEAAPWASIVQRAGRCNRYGEVVDALLLWVEPPNPAPYDEADVDAAIGVLCQLQDREVTPASMPTLGPKPQAQPHAVLRRRDLISLFDTTPDLSGNDIDIGRFIRDQEDLDVQVAWRPMPEERLPVFKPTPAAEELCRVPIGDLSKWVKDPDRPAWTHDPRSENWRPMKQDDVRPGLVVVLPSSAGGYDNQVGWSLAIRTDVEPVLQPETDALSLGNYDEAAGGDAATTIGRWVSLVEHLTDVEAAVRAIHGGIDPDGLLDDHLEAAAAAGRLHDLGKVHPDFQDALVQLAPQDKRAELSRNGPYAKSGHSKLLRHKNKGFRHELVSILALMDDPSLLDGVPDPDLVLYLVGAHHGRVRLGVRSRPEEADREPAMILGVQERSVIPPTPVPGASFGGATMKFESLRLGSTNGGRSWSRMALALRDRADLGPFRLGFLEAIVRLADWRASAEEADRA